MEALRLLMVSFRRAPAFLTYTNSPFDLLRKLVARVVPTVGSKSYGRWLEWQSAGIPVQLTTGIKDCPADLRRDLPTRAEQRKRNM